MHHLQKFSEFALRKGNEGKEMAPQPFPWKRTAWLAPSTRVLTQPYILRLQRFLPRQGHHVKIEVVPSSSTSNLGVNEHWNLTHAPFTKPSTPKQDCICLGKGTSFLHLNKGITWVSIMHVHNMHYVQAPKTRSHHHF